MPNFIIKTHQKATIYKKSHLFILNKGLNSGKPQKEPFTNSFVIIFENDSDLQSIYFIAYSLWKSNYWHHFLIGSVIPFLRLANFKSEFNSKAGAMMNDHKQHQKNITALKLLEQQEIQSRETINKIKNLRKAIIYRYCQK